MDGITMQFPEVREVESISGNGPEQLKRQIPIGELGEQWEQQYFYSKKDRYIILAVKIR